MAKVSLALLLTQRWQRLSHRQRLVVGGVIGFLVLWLVDAVALRPLRRHVKALQKQVQQTEKQLVEAVAANQNAEAIARAFKTYQPYASAPATAESELAGLLSDVESTVRQSGMVLLNLKPSGKPAVSDKTIGVVIDAESTPEQLVRLLDNLQRSQKLIKATELSIRVSEQKILRISMVISKLLLKAY